MRSISIKIFIISCLFCLHAGAQNILLNQLVQNRFNEITLNADTAIFTGFRATDWLEYQNILSRNSDIQDSIFGLSPSNKNYFLRNFTTSNWVQLSNEKHVFVVDPFIDANIGKSSKIDNAIYARGAGVRIQGVLNNKLSYTAGYIGRAEKFPSYLYNNIIENYHYVPGIGKAGLKSDGHFNSNQVYYNITFNPNKHFLISAGNGKNFIGDGYRSLLLSDNVNNNLYLRLQGRYWRLTYDVVYNLYNNPRYIVDGSSQKKYSVYHYLGINVAKKLQLGLFDNVIWYAKDTGIQRGFDPTYLSPLLFLKSSQYTVGSPDNSLIGFTAKYKLFNNGFIYGQVSLDDISFTKTLDEHKQYYTNKYALQLGIWNKDVFKLKGLSHRLEWNGVRPYTYNHGFDKPGLNYTHDNQSLADPFNANFHEFISIFQYHKLRWYASIENLYTIRGENPGVPYNNGEDLWGGEDNIPDYGSKTLQGIKHHYFYNQLSAGYLLNPKNMLSIQADAVYRNHAVSGASVHEFYFSVGVKTNLFNYYRDF